ncbi:hypothetical protein FAI40_04130 [Acetobacteraceae bacterium]|nr:hypothetical protein FAI40_04130 [Acetobacteraceae bacterium]
MRLSVLKSFLGTVALLAGMAVMLPLEASAQMVGVISHLRGVQEVDYVSHVQAWVSTRTRIEDGASSDRCALIYYALPRDAISMGAPISFVRDKQGYQVRALNSQWPILPNNTGQLSMRVKGHLYTFEMQSDEGGVISGPLASLEMRQILDGLSEMGEDPSSEFRMSYSENKSAHDSRYDGNRNGVLSNVNVAPERKAKLVRDRRKKRVAAKTINRHFSVPVVGIEKPIAAFDDCSAELKEKYLDETAKNFEESEVEKVDSGNPSA